MKDRMNEQRTARGATAPYRQPVPSQPVGRAVLTRRLAAVALAWLLAATTHGQQDRAQAQEIRQEAGVTGGLYRREATLAETLVNTRQRYRTGFRQADADRVQLQIGPWRVHGPVTGTQRDQPPPATETWKPLEGNKELARRVDGAFRAYVAAEATADRAGEVWLGLVSGPTITLMVNDQPVALREDAGSTKESYDGLKVRREVTARVPVKPGLNRLLVTVAGEQGQTFLNVPFECTANPSLAGQFWAAIRRDFPPADHPFFALANFRWFEPTGWFDGAGTELESALVTTLGQRIAARTGDDWPARELAALRAARARDDDPRWVQLTLAAAAQAQALEELAALDAAVAALEERFGDRYPAARYRAELAAWRPRLAAETRSGAAPAELAAKRRDWLVARNPMLAGQKVLFLRRAPYNAIHYYDFFQNGAKRLGTDLCVWDVDSGQVTSVLPVAMRDGWVDRFDLDFDAQRVVFSYRDAKLPVFCLWELDLGTKEVRPLTQPTTAQPVGDGHLGNGEGDVQPCYLPDGDIVFASTRNQKGVLCTPGLLKTTALFRMKRDGSGLRPLSQGMLHELAPAIMEDGQVLYNRWEYVYKTVFTCQPLWMMRPDGTGSEEIYGNSVTLPPSLMFGRQLPGQPGRFVAVGCGHERYACGPIGLIDLALGKRNPQTWRSLTPEVEPRPAGHSQKLRNGRWVVDEYGPMYCDPFPLDGQFFLVAHNSDRHAYAADAFGLALLDVFGNRVPLLAVPDSSVWCPVLLAPRRRPPVLPPLAQGGPDAPGTLFISDVYQGLPGVPRGSIKYLRVLEQVPKPWRNLLPDYAGDANAYGHGPVVSYGAHLWVAALHGVVPVQSDGSAMFSVPADRNLYFQALDDDYQAVQTMRTFINLRPGEKRSCIGCHEERTQAPAARPTLAMRGPVTELQPQPGDSGPRPIHYPADIQPILDRHCVRCHGPEKPAGKLDLTGRENDLFTVSHVNLLNRGVVSLIGEFGQPPEATPLRRKAMQSNRVEPYPPYALGVHNSRLPKMLEAGHHDVRLSREERVKLNTWIDANCQFYGSYLGRRHIKAQNLPNYRPEPTFAEAINPIESLASRPGTKPQP